MRIRPYIECRDFDEIKNWMTDERIHAMWCASRFLYPLEKEDFHTKLHELANQWGDSPYVATTDDGKLIGFFCYSVNLETNEGMLKFVMINPSMRGNGFGQSMLKLALQYAFDITNVDAVHLNVYPENVAAKKCYEAVGFVQRKLDLNAFTYKEEAWGRCNMVINRKK